MSYVAATTGGGIFYRHENGWQPPAALQPPVGSVVSECFEITHPYVSAPERHMLRLYKKYAPYPHVYGNKITKISPCIRVGLGRHEFYVAGAVTHEPPLWLPEFGPYGFPAVGTSSWSPQPGLTALGRYWDLLLSPSWSVYEQLSNIKE